MDFENYLEVSAHQLNEEIDQILSEFLNNVKNTSIKLLPLALGFINSCRGGKKVRGSLAKLGYEIGQSLDKDEKNLKADSSIIKVGAALEILHAAILIHDDVVDQSPKRRGQPTLYMALGGDHYGMSQAIGLGDIGLYLPIKIIADLTFPPQYKTKALSFLSQIIVNTGWGQILDVELPHKKTKQIEEDIILIQKLKTAGYTISGPLQIGAILAGANEELIRVLGEFGEVLGIAFQIQDDILGVFGEEEKIGKSATSDILEGKNTLLYVESLKRADLNQKKVLEKYYGQSNVSLEGVLKVREVFSKTGALDYSNKKALEYTNKARKIIPNLTKDKKMSTLLQQMCDYLIERNK